MEAALLARGRVTLLGYARIAAALLAAPALLVGPAYADDAVVVAGAQAGPVCVVKGTFPGPKGTSIFDAPSGGRAVATFSGAAQAMAMSELPADPTAGRARVSTSLGTASFRVDGWVAPGAFAVFTTRDVPVQPGHVWITGAQRVKLVPAAGGAVGVEISLAGSGQAVRAAAACDALALQPGAPTAMEVPGNGRGYVTKGSALELFDEPGGSAVFTLRVPEGASQLFWSTEARAGFVHVKARGELAVDAWARASSLEPLKKGEMMDQFIPPTTAYAGAQLALDKPPRLLQAAREIPVRAHRDDKEKPIGAVEAGAEVYVMETLLGWTNVLPRNLGLTPADDGGFWVPSAEVSR